MSRPLHLRLVGGIEGDGIEGTVHRVGRLGKKHRVVRQFFHDGVLARLLAFLEVVEIIPADAVDVAVGTGNRREELRLFQRDQARFLLRRALGQRVRLGEAGVAAFD
jgi:hypothetical protein